MTTHLPPLPASAPAPIVLVPPVEALTRAAVHKVFKEMLNLDMCDDDTLPLAEEEMGQIISSVGFIGQVTGVIHLYAGMSFARTITSRMVGLEEAEVDNHEMVNDAMAELGNVLVGAVKSQLCDLGWVCTLTIPSVMRGHHLRIESVSRVAVTVLGFRAGGQRLIVEMLVKDL